MPRTRLSLPELLESIASNRRADVTTARALFAHARTCGAELKPAQNSVSVRMPGSIHKGPKWLTLFVVSDVSTFYTNWTDRWETVARPNVARRYLQQLRVALGSDPHCHPSAYRRAIPLSSVRRNLGTVQTAVAAAAGAIRIAVKDAVQHSTRPVTHKLADYEGALTETRAYRRSRSRRLRAAALEASRGRCRACGRDYGSMLGGRGWRVLQAHHLRQLASTDVPRLTSIDEIAILCANCHLLVHYDPAEAMDPADLAAMLKADR